MLQSFGMEDRTRIDLDIFPNSYEEYERGEYQRSTRKPSKKVALTIHIDDSFEQPFSFKNWLMSWYIHCLPCRRSHNERLFRPEKD